MLEKNWPWLVVAVLVILVLVAAQFVPWSRRTPSSHSVALPSRSAAVDSAFTRMYYTQRFDREPLDVVDERQVSLEEAKIILEEFYSSGFTNGDIFIIGFSHPEDGSDFIEYSKDDTGKLSIIRVEKPGEPGVFEESQTDLDSALSHLATAWE